MPLSPDWSTSTPADHTKLNTGPGSVRTLRELLADRLSAIISGFVSGDTVKGIVKLPFIAQSTPTLESDKILIYGKDVSGNTELHSLDDSGTESQLTKKGGPSGLNLTAAQLLALVGPSMMPVGFVVTLGVSTNPATLFGFGTWTQISGKVIVGLDSGDTDFDVLNETGGAKTVTLTAAQSGLPAHTHTMPLHSPNSGGTSGVPQNTPGPADTTSAATNSTGGTAASEAHPNLQPYIVKYVWERTA